MDENLTKWTEKIIPWLLDHGLKIVVIAVTAYLLNIILTRIVARAIRIAVVADETMSAEAEKKREDTLIHISNGAIRISLSDYCSSDDPSGDGP